MLLPDVLPDPDSAIMFPPATDVDDPLSKLVTPPEVDDEEPSIMSIAPPVLEPDTLPLIAALSPTPRAENPVFNYNSPPMFPELGVSSDFNATVPLEHFSVDPAETLIDPPDPYDPSPDETTSNHYLYLIRYQC